MILAFLITLYGSDAMALAEIVRLFSPLQLGYAFMRRKSYVPTVLGTFQF